MSSARPPFVLIHGAWYNAATWRAVVPLLETRGYMARALDLPGTGANAKLPISYQHRPLDAKAFATEPSPNTATQQQRTRAITSLVHEEPVVDMLQENRGKCGLRDLDCLNKPLPSN